MAKGDSDGVKARRAALWLSGVLLLCFVYFLPRYGDWDQNSRYDMALAMVNDGTIAIDNYRWNSGDVARFDGHYYSIMAPGQAISAVPLAWAMKTVASSISGPQVGAGIGRAEHREKRLLYYCLLLYLECCFTAGAPAILLVLLFFWFLGYFTASLRNRLGLSLAFGLATMIFPYAQAMYSHVPATALLFAGFVLIYVVGTENGARGPKSAWLRSHPQIALILAGGLLGASEVYEYPAAVVGVPIFVYACTRIPLRLLPCLIVGAIPGLLVVGAYDFAAYHNPLMSGYSAHSVLWKGKLAHGIGGSTWPPRPEALWGLSFSPYRGLFFISPMLLLAIPGLVLWARRGRDWILFLSIPIVYALVISMSPFWFAGSTVGPRYLIPTLPFLAVPIIFVLDRARNMVQQAGIAGLMLLSGANAWLQTLGRGGFPPENVHNPLFTFSLPGVWHDQLPLSIGSAFLAPFHGMFSKATLIPLVCMLTVWSIVVVRRAGTTTNQGGLTDGSQEPGLAAPGISHTGRSATFHRRMG